MPRRTGRTAPAAPAPLAPTGELLAPPLAAARRGGAADEEVDSAAPFGAAAAAEPGAAAKVSEARPCMVCLDAPRAVVLTACGHALLCQSCLDRLLEDNMPECPLCAAPIAFGLRSEMPWRPLAEAAELASPASYMPSAIDDSMRLRSAFVRVVSTGAGEANMILTLVQLGVYTAGRFLARVAALGFEDVVRQLVTRYGANPNDCDNNGNLPIVAAAWEGHLGCVRALVELGADVNAAGDDGKKPLHRAVDGGNADCVRLLVELGADLACADSHGATPLHRAAVHGDVNLVRLLVDLGADVDCVDDYGREPRHRAMRCGHTQCVRVLTALVQRKRRRLASLGDSCQLQ